MVRPKLPPDVRKSRTLPPLRLTKDEYRRVADAARARGLSLTEYAREKILGAKRVQRRNPR